MILLDPKHPFVAYNTYIRRQKGKISSLIVEHGIILSFDCVELVGIFESQFVRSRLKLS